MWIFILFMVHLVVKHYRIITGDQYAKYGNSTSFYTNRYIFLSFLSFRQISWETMVESNSQTEYLMQSQGTGCPSYKFIHGNAKEISQVRERSISQKNGIVPPDVSRISEPHIYSWINVYGKSNQPLAFIVLHLLRNSFVQFSSCSSVDRKELSSLARS